MKTCGKKLFKTFIQASTRAKEINKENRVMRCASVLNPYKCKNCNGYHLTSMTKKDYKNLNTPEGREQLKHEIFIKEEAEYWTKKLKPKKEK